MIEELVHTTAGELKAKDLFSVGQKFIYQDEEHYKIRITEKSQESNQKQSAIWRESKIYTEYSYRDNPWDVGWFYKTSLVSVDEWKN